MTKIKRMFSALISHFTELFIKLFSRGLVGDDASDETGVEEVGEDHLPYLMLDFKGHIIKCNKMPETTLNGFKRTRKGMIVPNSFLVGLVYCLSQPMKI